MAEQQTSILIVGGGAAGVSVANNLRRKNKALDITLVEPSEKHYYQPGFTIVGGGAYTLKQATRNQVDLIHSSIKWVKEYAVSFQPDQNQITLQSGQILDYDYLVVCPGLQIDFDKIEGLSDRLGKNGVCCNYSVDHVEYTWEILQNLSSGRALFTQPSMPIKCAGAPQKIMYLAADRFRQQGTSEQVDVQFFNAGPAMFGIPFFAKALSKVVQDYGIKTNFGANLVAVNGETKQATFEISDGC
jgi:sulfide:quinone oxidoreductase